MCAVSNSCVARIGQLLLEMNCLVKAKQCHCVTQDINKTYTMGCYIGFYTGWGYGCQLFLNRN